MPREPVCTSLPRDTTGVRNTPRPTQDESNFPHLSFRPGGLEGRSPDERQRWREGREGSGPLAPRGEQATWTAEAQARRQASTQPPRVTYRNKCRWQRRDWGQAQTTPASPDSAEGAGEPEGSLWQECPAGRGCGRKVWSVRRAAALWIN